MKPVNITAVYFAKDTVLFPIKKDKMHYPIAYPSRQDSVESLESIGKEDLRSKPRVVKAKNSKKN